MELQLFWNNKRKSNDEGEFVASLVLRFSGLFTVDEGYLII